MLLKKLFLLIAGMGMSYMTQAQPAPIAKPVNTGIEWFGHGFFVFTTVTGIRVAIDPFSTNLLAYPLPNQISADVVLITHETGDVNYAQGINGKIHKLQSAAGVGINKGSGLLFKGTRSYRTSDREISKKNNVIFSFKIDGIRMVHLGGLGHPLNSMEVESVGSADVVIAPIGYPDELSPSDVVKVAQSLGAKILIPAFYGTIYSMNFKLGDLDSFLKACTLPVKRLEGSGFSLKASELPQQLEIWIPALPAHSS